MEGLKFLQDLGLDGVKGDRLTALQLIAVCKIVGGSVIGHHFVQDFGPRPKT